MLDGLRPRGNGATNPVRSAMNSFPCPIFISKRDQQNAPTANANNVKSKSALNGPEKIQNLQPKSKEIGTRIILKKAEQLKTDKMLAERVKRELEQTNE
jgi:hypothetical protein